AQTFNVALPKTVLLPDGPDGFGVAGRLLPKGILCLLSVLRVHQRTDRVEVDVDVGIGPVQAAAAGADLEVSELLLRESCKGGDVRNGTAVEPGLAAPDVQRVAVERGGGDEI